MKLTTIHRTLFLALGLMGVVDCAKAVNFVEVDGTHLQFFYDADFWGIGAASVSGDSITFNTNDLKASVSVKLSSSNGSSSQDYSDFTTPGLVAVLKSSAQSVDVSNTLKADYVLASGGKASASLSGDIKSGSFSGGMFSPSASVGAFDQLIKPSSPGTGSLSQSSPASLGSWDMANAIGINASILLHADQQGGGMTSISMTQAVYSFDVTPVATPVPEPESYAMLLAGLGLVGVVARRRKAAK